MDLTDWRLNVRVVVDGRDMSGRFRPMLSSLTITDSTGLESDELQVELAIGQLFGAMAFPRAGAEIEVFLGSGFSAARIGLFVADSFEASGPPDVMRISAKAAVFSGGGGKTGLQDAKSRSWDAGTTVGGLVGRVASEHGLKPAVSESLRGHVLGHVDQVDESDMNLLTRLARDLDAVAKPGGGALIFTRRGEGLSASGEPLPTIRLRRHDIGRWSVSLSEREAVASVVALWRDKGAAKDQEVRVGEGKPETRLRHRYATEGEARSAAEAALARSKRGKLSVGLTLPGRADLVAEGRVVIPTGLHPDLAGEWLVTRVTHQVSSGGWATSLDAEALGD